MCPARPALTADRGRGSGLRCCALRWRTRRGGRWWWGRRACVRGTWWSGGRAGGAGGSGGCRGCICSDELIPCIYFPTVHCPAHVPLPRPRPPPAPAPPPALDGHARLLLVLARGRRLEQLPRPLPLPLPLPLPQQVLRQRVLAPLRPLRLPLQPPPPHRARARRVHDARRCPLPRPPRPQAAPLCRSSLLEPRVSTRTARARTGRRYAQERTRPHVGFRRRRRKQGLGRDAQGAEQANLAGQGPQQCDSSSRPSRWQHSRVSLCIAKSMY